MATINEKRLRELERAEKKLAALEAGGVDNWEWYSESLKSFYAEEQREEDMEELLNELAVVFGECAYEPSERGAGIAFNESAFSEGIKVLNSFKVYFKRDDGDD